MTGKPWMPDRCPFCGAPMENSYAQTHNCPQAQAEQAKFKAEFAQQLKDDPGLRYWTVEGEEVVERHWVTGEEIKRETIVHRNRRAYN